MSLPKKVTVGSVEKITVPRIPDANWQERDVLLGHVMSREGSKGSAADKAVPQSPA